MKTTIKLDKIEINNLGSHKQTKIKLEDKMNLIFATNGTGKSLFSASLSTINDKNFSGKQLRGWNKSSNITIYGNNKKNVLKMHKDEIKWSSNSGLSPDIKLFDDWNFMESLVSHYDKNALMSFNKTKNKMQKLERIISYSRLFNQEIDKFKKLSVLPSKLMEKLLIHEKKSYPQNSSFAINLKELKNTTPRKLLVTWNSNIKNKSMTNLELKIIKIYKYFKKNKLSYTNAIENNYFQNYEEFLNVADDKPIQVNSASIQKIKNSIDWYKYFISPFSVKQNLKRETGSLKEFGNMELNFTDINFWELEHKKLASKLKQEKSDTTSMALELRKVIQGTELGEKITISDELFIMRKNSKSTIILSTGEAKFLNLILFIKNITNEIVIFDDPLTSMDSSYILIIMKYIKYNLRRNQIIFLTHNDLVLNIFKKIYWKDVRNKERGSQMINWVLDDNFYVKTGDKNLASSKILSLSNEIRDNSLANHIRLSSCRKLLEYFSLVWKGHAKFSEWINQKNKKDSMFFGKAIPLNQQTIEMLNDASHISAFDLTSGDEKEKSLKYALNDFIQWLDSLGFKPFTDKGPKVLRDTSFIY